MILNSKLHFIKSKRKTLCIEVISENEIKIKMPFFFSKRKALDFVHEKQNWILKKQNTFVKQEIINSNINENQTLYYLGKPFVIKKHPSKCILLIDHHIFVSNNWTEQTCQKKLILWFKEKAEDIFKDRTDLYAQQMNLFPKKLLLSNAKKRWGSCTSTKIIRLNWRLINCPIPIIDYVIVHELAHLKEMNHGKQFWNLVKTHFPKYKESQEWLKNKQRLLESFR